MESKKLDLGPVQKLIDDPSISEIMVNGPKKIFVEKNGKKMLSDSVFSGEEELLRTIEKFFSAVGKRVGKDIPYGDVCLEDGTRVNIMMAPVSRFGTAVTFRKFSKQIGSLQDLIANGTLTQKAAEFLIASIKGKINIIFSGGTGTGKTTLLQMLSNYFAPQERVVTIEDAAELRFTQENYISMETRTPDEFGKGGVSLKDLISNALRMTPDRIIVGEVRGEEAINMFQAMATGHSGTIGVVHGNSPKDVVARLETMVLMSGMNIPMLESRKIIASTINLIVHLERVQDGSRKVTYITEVRGLDNNEILLNDLFSFSFEKMENDKVIGSLKPTIKYYPLFFQRFQKLNLLANDIFVSD
ncbi:MAG: ATPase, T2SS/T4P/T4SS family [Candidatus Omnitrophica bacterium]|nr:ATPase, T2SS/T4P/T4SS family [Candidatus Omnitrophota bacterium]